MLEFNELGLAFGYACGYDDLTYDGIFKCVYAMFGSVLVN